MWNDVPYTVLDTGTLDWFNGASQPLVASLSYFFMAQVLVGLRKQFINNFVFLTWACAAGFNNYNNNDNYIVSKKNTGPILTFGPHRFKIYL